jgi:hypothetical protein
MVVRVLAWNGAGAEITSRVRVSPLVVRSRVGPETRVGDLA